MLLAQISRLNYITDLKNIYILDVFMHGQKCEDAKKKKTFRAIIN